MNDLRKKRRRGMGIAELAVVIAVISIVSLIVVSFTLMVSDKVRNSREKVNAMNDITVIESIVDTWITKNIEEENLLYFYDLSLYDKNDPAKDLWSTDYSMETQMDFVSFDKHYVFEFSETDKEIRCLIPDNEVEEGVREIIYQTDSVESIHFNVGKKPDEGDIEDIIFFCTITYQVAVSNSNSVTHTYTFVINPRVGDKVGA